MAKVSNPLFSLKASGNVGKAVSYQKTRTGQRAGICNGPKGTASTAQLVERALLSAIASTWSKTFNALQVRAAWRAASVALRAGECPQNLFFRLAHSLAKSSNDVAFCDGLAEIGGAPVFDMRNVLTGLASTEAGTFSIYSGTTKTDLTLWAAEAIAAGTLTGPAISTPGTYYFNVMKNGVSRSGIIALTISGGPTPPDYAAAWAAFFTEEWTRGSWTLYGSYQEPVTDDFNTWKASVIADGLAGNDHAFSNSITWPDQIAIVLVDWETGELSPDDLVLTLKTGDSPDNLPYSNTMVWNGSFAWMVPGSDPLEQYWQVELEGIKRSGIYDTWII